MSSGVGDVVIVNIDGLERPMLVTEVQGDHRRGAVFVDVRGGSGGGTQYGTGLVVNSVNFVDTVAPMNLPANPFGWRER